ncbi:hypothetical protein [Nocardioides sp.]|uniref:hypothetical protein n=1 Tax=Nocardioides sp. TaxID=35761 RepID=UPI003D0CFAA9
MSTLTYAKRKRLKQELEGWLQKRRFHVFLTLTLNTSSSADAVSRKFKAWLAQVDRWLIGNNWHKDATNCVFAVAAVEHLNTNAHLHILLRLPRHARHKSPLRQAKKYFRFWTKVIRSGGCCLSTGPDQGAVSYILKCATDEDAFNSIMFSNQFHGKSRRKCRRKTARYRARGFNLGENVNCKIIITHKPRSHRE